MTQSKKGREYIENVNDEKKSGTMNSQKNDRNNVKKLDIYDKPVYNIDKSIKEGNGMVMRVLGYKTLIDPQTHENYKILVNEIGEDIVDLNRIILKQVVKSFNFRLKRLDVANFIIDNLDNNYRVWMSQQAIAKELNMGDKTVYYTLRQMREYKILLKEDGHYKVNPIFLCKDDKETHAIGFCYIKE